VQEFLGRG